MPTNPLRTPVLSQCVIISGPKPGQVRQQVPHKPAELRQLANSALRQLQRFTLPGFLECVPALCQSKAEILLRRISAHHERPQLRDQRIRNEWPNERSGPLRESTERCRVTNQP